MPRDLSTPEKRANHRAYRQARYARLKAAAKRETRLIRPTGLQIDLVWSDPFIPVLDVVGIDATPDVPGWTARWGADAGVTFPVVADFDLDNGSFSKGFVIEIPSGVWEFRVLEVDGALIDVAAFDWIAAGTRQSAGAVIHRAIRTAQAARAVRS